MTLLKGLRRASLAMSVTLFSAMPAWAERSVEHAKTTLDLVDILAIIVVGIVFIGGLCVLGYTGWRVAGDYIWKNQQGQEGKFSFGKVIAGLVLGGFLVAPSGAFLMAQSISVGDNNAAQFEESDFRRPPSS